jgi:zinc and cadmium transporter
VSPFAAVLLATTVIDVLELGAIIFIVTKLWSELTEMRLLSFAAGVLLATIFLDLLPEATSKANDDRSVCIAVLAAMIGLFLLERLLQRDHSHTHSVAHAGHHHPAPSRYFIVIGDGIHSAVDGLAIAIAFMADSRVGLITTLAVLAHEVPHQVGDYSILVRSGIPMRRAILLNFSSAAAALLGVVLAFALGSAVEEHIGILLGATAGMLLYITSVTLLPEILHSRLAGRFLYTFPFTVGLTVIAAGAIALPV